MPTEADLVRSIDAEALADWVVGQRWFASKAREVTVGLAEVLVLNEDPPLGLALVEEAEVPRGDGGGHVSHPPASPPRRAGTSRSRAARA